MHRFGQKRLWFSLFLAASIIAPPGALAQFGPHKKVFEAGGGALLERVQVGDFDKDGDIDVLTKRWGTYHAFWVRNDGQGNFSSVSQLPNSNMADLVSIQVLDYDKDGDPDVAGAYDGGKILLWTNPGTGSFGTPLTLSSLPDEVVSLTIEDIDGDNDQDIAVATADANSYYFENDRVLGVWNKKPLNAGHAYYISFGKSATSVPDVYSISNRLSKNGVQVSDAYIASAKFLKATDIDRDGDVDVFAANNESTEGILWFENMNGSYTAHVIENSAGPWYYSITVFDYDGDGDDDLFAGCWVDCGINLFENQGAGIFSLIQGVGAGAQRDQELVSADIDGDNRLDLIHNNSATHEILWQSNQQVQFQGIQAAFLTEGQCVGTDVLFKSAARGKNITSWSWNFGDGSPSSSVRSPAHQFTQPGTYTVSHTVTNAAGQSHTVQNVVVISLLDKMEDRAFWFCTNFAQLDLDPSYDYKWYTSATDTDVFATGPQMTFFNNQVMYVTRSLPLTGCVSARTRITGQWLDYPLAPQPTDAFSYHGPAELVFSTSFSGDDTIKWTNPQGDLLAIGPSYYNTFNETTTLYVQAVNVANCVSPRVPVTAHIYNSPVTVPTFTWGDATQSDSWSDGLDLVQDANGNFLVYGLWSQNKYRVGSYEFDANGKYARFITRYSKNGAVLHSVKVIGDTFEYFSKEAIAVDNNNDTYISFEYQNAFDFLGHAITAPPSTAYTFVGKVSASGAYLWHTILTYRKAAFSIFADGTPVIAENINGSKYITLLSASTGAVASQFQTTVDVEDMATDTNDNLYIGGGDKLTKFSRTGTTIWQKDLLANAYFSSIRKLVVDSNEDIVIAGLFFTDRAVPSTYEETILGTPLGSGGSAFIAKLSPSGALVWANRPNITIAGVADLDVDQDGNLFLVSRPQGHYTRISKFNPDGQFLWNRDLADNGLLAIAPDDEGNAAIYGSFEDEIQLDQITLTSATNSPVFVNFNSVIAKLGNALKASFINPLSCAGNNIQFTDMSTHSDAAQLASWAWSFGNGSTSTQQHPQYQYNAPGMYTVTLTVTDMLSNQSTYQSTLNIAPALSAPVVQSTGNNFCEGTAVNLSVSPSLIYQNYKWSTNAATPTIAVTETGGYSVSRGFGDCWSPPSPVVQINFNPRPDPPVIATSNPVACEGSSVMLSAEETYGAYLWSNGSTSQQLVTSTSAMYTLRAGTALDCLSAPSAPLTVLFNPAPIASIEMEENQLWTPVFGTYRWFLNSTLLPDTDSLIMAELAGSYTVEVTNAAGCSTLSLPVIYLISGLEAESASASVWPNPFHDWLHISIPQGPVTVTILDVTGRACHKEVNTSGSLNLGTLAPGVYMAQIVGADEIVRTIRIVKAY